MRLQNCVPVAFTCVPLLTRLHFDQKFTGTTLGVKPDLGSLTVAGCDLIVEVEKSRNRLRQLPYYKRGLAWRKHRAHGATVG
jgi:hypothetical protein